MFLRTEELLCYIEWLDVLPMDVMEHIINLRLCQEQANHPIFLMWTGAIREVWKRHFIVTDNANGTVLFEPQPEIGLRQQVPARFTQHCVRKYKKMRYEHGGRGSWVEIVTSYQMCVTFGGNARDVTRMKDRTFNELPFWIKQSTNSSDARQLIVTSYVATGVFHNPVEAEWCSCGKDDCRRYHSHYECMPLQWRPHAS